MYVLVQKVLDKVTDQSITTEVAISKNITDILEDLTRRLKEHIAFGGKVTMYYSKSFEVDTESKYFIYTMEVKPEPVIQIWRKENG